MTYVEASAQYRRQFYSGRKSGKPEGNYVFPFGCRYRDDWFVEVELPIAWFSPRPRCPELVPDYAARMESGAELPPVWVSLGRKFKDGSVTPFWDRKPVLLDGNHRMLAGQLAGLVKIKAVIPESHCVLLEQIDGS